MLGPDGDVSDGTDDGVTGGTECDGGEEEVINTPSPLLDNQE